MFLDYPLTNTKNSVYASYNPISDWRRETIHATVEAVVNKLEVGFGKVGIPTLLTVSGGAPSPDLDLVIYLVGKEACLRRFDKALEFIKAKV
jgi:glutamyl-tRNA synthetase